MMTDKWTALFCAECGDKHPPEKMENYNGHYLCSECDCDEVLSQQPQESLAYHR